MPHLRYRRDHPYGQRFPTLTYPSKPTTRERCEQMRAAMPDPEAFEVCEEEE